jgi:hypothetical protein
MTGVTYVLTHSALGSVKVGYTTTRSNRIDYLIRNGWDAYRYLFSESGAVARQVEQETLFELRHRLYIPAHLTADVLPDGGWTETSSLSLISAQQLWDIVCEQAGRVQLSPGRGRWMRRPPAHYRRRKGDTPRFVRAARVEAARTARAAQIFAPNQTAPKAATKDQS